MPEVRQALGARLRVINEGKMTDQEIVALLTTTELQWTYSYERVHASAGNFNFDAKVVGDTNCHFRLEVREYNNSPITIIDLLDKSPLAATLWAVVEAYQSREDTAKAKVKSDKLDLVAEALRGTNA